MKKLLMFLLFISGQLIFACNEMKDIGCFIMVEDKAPLVIYFRGHNKGRAELANDELFDSASQVAKKAQLAQLALKLKVNILVTGSSRIIVTKTLLENYDFDKLYLAAHSGGYYGLWKTLEDKTLFPHLKKLIFLDSYYSESKQFHQLIADLSNNDIPCVGYLTEHNLKRFNRHYKNLGCTKNGPEGFQHSKDVNRCLSQFIQGNECHGQNISS